METVPEFFGSKVFDDRVMKARLSADVYNSLKKTIQEGSELDLSVANAVADAMCTWAVENGATHFTHWFQPLTGITAEKHDSFISPAPDGRVIMDFSGKELIKGEPDASSFPSGGLRATFEARGYTAWDPTSYAFIKDKTLCIPTAFCSYSGEALDKKTPLLRSMDAINRQALRVLKLFGNKDVKHVTTSVGPEQEYFLIDKEMFEKRRDLVYTGRTLFGAKPPKGQELDDHYFGTIKPRVQAYMNVAPSQHELAPIYTTTNRATDHNQLTMEVMQRVARKHGMVCLLHEKPFAGVNGSGKHNNWSIATDTGMNLLSPGETPHENTQFLLFLVAIIKAVDDYQDLLRLSVATAGNDHRLGANEAPPAIVSIFLGDELEAILEAIESDAPYAGTEKKRIRLGADVLPYFTRDTTDRNRTSPFAFTGNKFEFRMVGSSNSIACANIMLNTAVAEALCQMADELEKADDFDSCLQELIKRTIREHKRIVFNGNGYDDSWVKEAVEKRGLLNLRTTPEAMARLLDEKNIRVLTKHTVMSEAEIRSRYEIMMENYCKTDMIEARTMVRMAKKDILPAIDSYMKELADVITAKQSVSPELACGHESKKLKKLSALADLIDERSDALDAMASETEKVSDITCQGEKIWKDLLPDMAALRQVCDETETLVGRKYWPFPTYGDLLFSVK